MATVEANASVKPEEATIADGSKDTTSTSSTSASSSATAIGTSKKTVTKTTYEVVEESDETSEMRQHYRPSIAAMNIIIQRSGGIQRPREQPQRGGYAAERNIRYQSTAALPPGVSLALVQKSGVGAAGQDRHREKKDLQGLNERLANYIEKVRYLEAQNRLIVDELGKLKSKWGKETSSVKAMYHAELDEARRILDEANLGKGRLEVRVASLEELLEELRKNLDDSRLTAAAERERAGSQLRQLGDLEAELDLLRTRSHSFETDREKDKKLIRQLQDQLHNARTDLDNETLLHIDAENRRQTLDEELEFHKIVHDQEMKELAALAYRDTTSENRDFWKHEMGQALREIQQTYDDKVDGIRSELETVFNQKVQQVRSGATQNNLQASHAIEETKRLRGQMGSLRDRLSDLDSKNAQLARELEALRREKEDTERRLTDENGDLKSEAVQLRAELEAIIKELERISDTKLGLELEIACYSKLLEREENRSQPLQPVKLKFEPVLTAKASLEYVTADEKTIFNRDHRNVHQDMNQPLSHYFIATSHNTYLTKDQLQSASSVGAYISALKRGCKCLELDCWDGPNNEPIIYHGHTLTSKILFKDVIQAIKEYAFCVSQYPVILSFENHCSLEQQRVMATHLKTILGNILHTETPPEDQTRLPSPEELRGYVLVKAKKISKDPNEIDDLDENCSDDDITEEDLSSFANRKKNSNDSADTISMKSDDVDENGQSAGDVTEKKKDSTLKNVISTLAILRKQKKEKTEVPKLAQELSDLVTYCQASSFKGFENAREKSKHYQMSSFGEKKAMKFSNEIPKDFLQYNYRQLSRIYPSGSRIDSSNYDPLPLWAVGCQMVALNYQTACQEMQLNQGLFRSNGGCGYVLKPQFMRQENISFDPRDTPAAAYTLTIKDIRGYRIPYKKNEKVGKSDRSLLVQVRTAGIDADNQVQRTTPVKIDGTSDPCWDTELTFKLHVPELALVHFAVYTKDSFLAQFALPFTSLMSGDRKLPLLNKHSDPVTHAYLLANISFQAPI